MKKIAIILGKFCAVNLFDFNHIYDSIRGLSGTDTILVEISKEFNKRGWDVSIFTCSFPNQPKEWFGCKIYDIERRFDVIQNDWTAIISINDPRDFIGLPDKPLKLFSQQLNGVSYLPPGWENLFDIATSPSQAHLDHHKSMYTQLHKWNVVEDACTYDPDLDLNKKISGRIIWTSSPDRGLHWLISIYPNIKKEYLMLL